MIEFSGLFFAVLQGLGEMDWYKQDIASMPGVYAAKILKRVLNLAESQIQQSISDVEGKNP